ncbi:MAG: hypothetical protein MUE73_18900, partial [Planctomycetes bacterium]|nr:hypothetical protein [Planctomycetota bacterium]
MGFRTCLLGLLPALFLAGLDSEREQQSRAASLSAPARPEWWAGGGTDSRAGADNPSGRGDPLRGASSLLVADRSRAPPDP